MITLHDLAMIGAGALLAVVVEGGTVAIVGVVLWRRHVRALDK